MNEETFTVIDYDGTVLDRYLTAREAASIILNHDGADFDIREGEYYGSKIFELWTRKQCANRPWTKTIVCSIEETRDEAEAEIFAEVCAARWPRHPEAFTDEQFDRMIAETEHDG